MLIPPPPLVVMPGVETEGAVTKFTWVDRDCSTRGKVLCVLRLGGTDEVLVGCLGGGGLTAASSGLGGGDTNLVQD